MSIGGSPTCFMTIRIDLNFSAARHEHITYFRQCASVQSKSILLLVFVAQESYKLDLYWCEQLEYCRLVAFDMHFQRIYEFHFTM